MPLISLSHISKYFGAELVLDDASVRIDVGDHVGLVGSNGAGKSTLLRIVAGLEEPDGGTVSRERGLRVSYLPQEPEFDTSHTLYEAMLEPFSDAMAAQEQLRELEAEMGGGGTSEDIEEYGRLQAIVEHAGYDYRARIERTLAGLGFENDLWYTPVENLSGGQRTRVNLGRTLLQDADLLLLDEPTNHLDIPAVVWLEGYLREQRRAFLIVAHDRYLLDRVTSRTVELASHRVTEYGAPYSRYLRLRAERVERQRQEYGAQQEHVSKTEEFIRRYGAGQRSKEARGRQKRLDRMERIERPQDEDTLSLRLAKPRRSGDIALELRRLVAGYPDVPLVRLPEEIVVNRGAKIAIIGPNGSGKTTLLKTLVGAIPALEGDVRWGAQTSVAYYSQTLGTLDDRLTVLAEIQSARAMSEEEARSVLGSFLFSGDDVFKTVGVLSGGERSRVALAKLILEGPNVLVLDEPTNHLDIASRDALQSVLAAFGGTLLFVSHDRFLIDGVAEELWAIGEGIMRRFAGTYSSYARGEAQALDRIAGEQLARKVPEESSDARVRRLETEAEGAADRLASAATTASLGQLAELTERYAEVLSALQEAQNTWHGELRKRRASFRVENRASSDSQEQSAAGRRR